MSDTTKVFISWSGEQSKIVAEALRGWLRGFFAGDPDLWMSEHDIEAGERWGKRLNEELEQSSLGVVCLTTENAREPWILFEAGSLAKSVEFSRVIPYCFGLTIQDIDYPLRQFQAVQANKEGTLKLVKTINRVRKIKLGMEDLNTSFEIWWPRLDEQLKKTPILQRMVVVDVSVLAENLHQILVKRSQSGPEGDVVKVLAADANHLLFRHVEPVLFSNDLQLTSFEFCLVDPGFAATADMNHVFAQRARKALHRIAELRIDENLVSRKIRVLPARIYRYYPNTWGILINDTDLFIGFHNWVSQKTLSGTQHGLIYLRKGDPLWDRFSQLFLSWFEHSAVWEETTH